MKMNPLYVHQSTLKAWRRCHNLYYYRYKMKIEPKRPKLQLLRGKIIGECLDHIVLERKKTKPRGSWESAVLEPYAKKYRRLFDEEREYYGDLIGDVRRIIHRYANLYKGDGLTYLKGKDGNPFELEVKVELLPGVIFLGHIDKLPKDRLGRTWVMDHKSHKVIPDPEKRFLDLQLLFYYWAAPLSGLPQPSGVLWDYIRTKPPTIPDQLVKGGLTQRKDIDTDYETYMGEIQRLELDPNDYKETLDRLKARGQADFFQRVYLPAPNRDMISNIVKEAKTTALEIKHLAGISRTRAMDDMCKSCDFYKICQAELRGQDFEFIKKSEYKEIEGDTHGEEGPEDE